MGAQKPTWPSYTQRVVRAKKGFTAKLSYIVPFLKVLPINGLTGTMIARRCETSTDFRVGQGKPAHFVQT